MAFEPLSKDDLRHVLRAMPRDARRLMVERSKQGLLGQIFLAGGAIRSVIGGEPVSDWDFLGSTPDTVGQFITGLKAARSGVPGRIYKTQNALTLLTLGHTAVQGITRWPYSNPNQLLMEFDFTIAQAVVWHDLTGWRSLASTAFYPDLAAKRLTYTNPVREEDAGGSILRVLKFIRRGYAISPEQLALVLGRLMEGYEWQSGVPLVPVITGLLRQVDPLARVDGLDFDDGTEDPLAPGQPEEGAA